MTDFTYPTDDGFAETEDERARRHEYEAGLCPECDTHVSRQVFAPAHPDACPTCGSVDPDDPTTVAEVRAAQAAALVPHAVETLDALAAKIADLWVDATVQAEGYVAAFDPEHPDVALAAYRVEWFRSQVGLIGNDLGSLADTLRPMLPR
jgi:hypothetical protein